MVMPNGKYSGKDDSHHQLEKEVGERIPLSLHAQCKPIL